jgi:hypothetical protein
MAHPSPAIDFARIGDKWSATAQTSTGPLTAIGDTIGEARIALEQMLVIARTLELTSERRRRRMR